MTGQPEPRAVRRFRDQVMRDLAAAAHAATVSLGDRLGLWSALAQGPASAQELSVRTGCDVRYLEEWLRAQCVSGYCERTDDGRFTLSAAQTAVLADPGQPSYVAGASAVVGVLHKDEELAAAAFRSGRGIPWHEHHEDLFTGTERLFRPEYTAHLVPEWLPAVDDVTDRLERGIAVADIGCGLGASTILLAEAYPRSSFAGFDYHERSIRTARRRAAQAGVADRILFETATADGYPGSYELVCAFNALHDVGDPVGAARHIRRSLGGDGVFVLVEPMAGEWTGDDTSPLGRLFYSASALICTPHARSQPGPHELGNQVPDSEWAALIEQAGFSRFRRVAATAFARVFEARA